MSIVLDASATIALSYNEAPDTELRSLKDAIKQMGAVVPQLWRLEIANVFLIGYRKGRHDPNAMKEYMLDLSRLRITVDEQTGAQAWESAFELAAKHRLTSYDAAYLELAARLRAPLATLDKDLARAARDEGVKLFWD